MKLDNAVELSGVTKRFGAHVAVDHLDLTVPTGSIYGFIGPNGSGKTTTLRMILRIFFPDEGTVQVLGDVDSRAVNDQVAYLPEERGLYKKMKVENVLKYYAHLKGMKNCDQEIDFWLERMGLAEWRKRKVEALSKGMAQKIQFISTIISEPKLVILDEPFSGLDPVNLEVMREAVLSLRERGTTIIFSTHDMAVAAQLCDTIFMIYRGRKVLDGSLHTIQRDFGEDILEVEMTRVHGGYEGLPMVDKVVERAGFMQLYLSHEADSQQLLLELARRGRIERFELCKPSLHDIFVRIAKPDFADNSDEAANQ